MKQYKVYAVIYTDAEGNPAVLWQLEKDGKGVTNPELYQFLDKEGKNLSPDLIELIDYNSWNEKIQNGWRNGYNYVTGETYNPALGSIIATSQYIQDGVTWLNETDIGAALQTLGFAYASYRMMTKNGPIMVENEQVSGAGKISKEVEIINRNGSPLGEFDEIDLYKGIFYEDKTAKGLDIANPRTGLPAQTPQQFADKQIYNKTAERIKNLQQAESTRPTKNGSSTVPSLDEIKGVKKFVFRLDGDSPELQKAVWQSIEKLKKEFPDYTFDAKFGGK